MPSSPGLMPVHSAMNPSSPRWFAPVHSATWLVSRPAVTTPMPVLCDAANASAPISVTSVQRLV